MNTAKTGQKYGIATAASIPAALKEDIQEARINKNPPNYRSPEGFSYHKMPLSLHTDFLQSRYTHVPVHIALYTSPILSL